MALSIRAELLLIDERKGTSIALKKGLEVTGTLSILRVTAQGGLIDLAEAFSRLAKTNFRYRQETLDAMLNELFGEK